MSRESGTWVVVVVHTGAQVDEGDSEAHAVSTGAPVISVTEPKHKKKYIYHTFVFTHYNLCTKCVVFCDSNFNFP